MEKFKYGPLVYITPGMDENEGNYFWNGSPPVGYDSDGIPVDAKGLQCLDMSCPLHPSHNPTEVEYCEVLASDLPTIASFEEWFDDNFLIVNEKQLRQYIIRWWATHTRRTNSTLYEKIITRYSSVEEIMEAVWPDAPQS